MKRLLAFSIASLLSAGCSISAVTDQSRQPTQNVCKVSADCGSGGVCTDGMCRAAEGKFSTIMFEITPPATSSGGFAGIRFLKTMQRLDTHGGKLDLSVDSVTDLDGAFVPTKADFQTAASCKFDTGKATDGSLPGKVTITSSAGSLGWPSGTATVDTSLVPTQGPNGESLKSNRFSLSLPPGKYDLYVQPTASTDTTHPLCAVPPVLFRHQKLDGGKVSLSLALPPPLQFSMAMKVPKSSSVMSFKGWTVQMVGFVTGRALSNPEKLVAKDLGDALEYDVNLAFSTVAGGDAKDAKYVGHELIKLSPPDGVPAPTFYMDRSALQLSSTNVEVDQYAQLLSPVKLEGTIEESDTLAPVQATVNVQSTDIAGLKNGTLAGYKHSYETDSQGRFTATVPPGTYRVQAIPKDPALAAREATWIVGETPSVQAGKVIGIDPSAKLTGGVLTPSGNNPLVGAPVQAVPSTAQVQTSMLQAALGGAPLTPRASSDVVDDKGLFTLRTDPGAFDVSVRPGDGTGFAWLVRSNVQVQSGIEDLGQMKLPLPVKYSGLVSVQPDDPGTAIPGALIRAYIFMDGQQSYTSDPDVAQSVLPIAETRADSDGKFQLLLPAHLN